MEQSDSTATALITGAASTDYFALLGLRESFAVDPSELEHRYLERSKVVHPDRFVSAPARERVAALHQSMQLNDAYRTLKKPLPRAEYLLTRHGVSIGDNEILDPEFLMEVLELREELAEAKHARDHATLRRLEDIMLDRQEAALATVAARFAALEAASPQGADDILAEIKRAVILLRYIRRYLEEFEDVFDEEEGQL